MCVYYSTRNTYIVIKYKYDIINVGKKGIVARAGLSKQWAPGKKKRMGPILLL